MEARYRGRSKYYSGRIGRDRGDGTYDVDYNVTPRNGSWPVSVVVYWYE